MDLVPLDTILAAAASLADPIILLWIVGGVLIGIIFGAAPGLTATAGVAIATPLTFSASFETAMALLLGIYCGGYFAGSIPAILINTPGAPGNAATAIDGYALARKGKADMAISIAVISSFIGGTISIIVLMVAAPSLSNFALKFTSVEYFSLGVFGLVCVASVSGGSMVKGFIGACFGMLLSTSGIDPVGGMTRFTFSIPEMLSGIPLIPALIAFFAITEMLSQSSRIGTFGPLPKQQIQPLRELVPFYLQNKWLTFKSALIGTGVGILPGTGPTIASWISLGEAARTSKTVKPQEHGDPRGIIAAETANNAVTGGALIPLLTLGIPGDTVTAVLIGALLIQGVDPGPFFIIEKADLFAQILLILLFANACILVIGLGARKILPSILRVPERILIPIIGVLCATGGFAINNTAFDVGLIAVLGMIGFLLVRFGFAMAPLVLGLVLGPIVEINLRDALSANDMDLTVFATRPISAVFLIAIFLTIVLSIWKKQRS